MALTFNPFELVKLMQEHQRANKNDFAQWLTRVQEEAQALLSMWTQIRADLEVSDEAKVSDAHNAILVKFGPQSVAAVYLKEFYGYASTVAAGRVQPQMAHTLAGRMANGIYLRNVTRTMAEQFVREAQAEKQMFYLNGDNKQKELNSLRDAIDALQEELVALDVFIETIKANPEAYR